MINPTLKASLRDINAKKYRNEYSSFTDAFLGWLQYKHWYKTEHIHQGLRWQTIPEFKHNRGLQQIAGYLEYQKIGA